MHSYTTLNLFRDHNNKGTLKRVQHDIKAFTLAEVLITLTTIGIVAVMTMPVLTAEYKEKATVTALKKFYSTMSQAYEQASFENILVLYGNGAAASSLAMLDFVKPYLKIVKECRTTNEEGCFASGYKTRDGSAFIINTSSGFSGRAVLSDGMAFTFWGGDGGDAAECTGTEDGIICGEVWVDVNSYKPPNKIGTDLFVFSVAPHKIIPKTSDSKYNCLDSTKRGDDCTAWVLRYENTDYLHCPKQLSWNGKTKCE